VLAVAVLAHAAAAIPKDEGTLCRGLRTSPLPGTHASVGDCWQNSRCCHLLCEEQHGFSDTLVSHPNVPDQLPGRLQRLQPPENRNAGPVNCIRWFGRTLAVTGPRPENYDFETRVIGGSGSPLCSSALRLAR
jgi:hypothetical protein